MGARTFPMSPKIGALDFMPHHPNLEKLAQI